MKREWFLRETRAFLIRIIIACVLFIGVLAMYYFEGEVYGVNFEKLTEIISSSWL